MSNLTDALKLRYPEEIPTIRATSSALETFPDIVIDRIWRAFSHERCASWLIPNGSNLTDFKEWIED